MTNNEIAAKLFVSVATVVPTRRFLAKFDARNIAMLIKTAVQLQLI